jgi:hypothetical protein
MVITIQNKLVFYGYTEKEALKLATEIQKNLDNYLVIQEKIRKEQNDRLRATEQSNSRGLLASLNLKRNHGG